MNTRSRRAAPIVIGAAMLVSSVMAAPATALPPTNDTESGAVVVTDVPFTHEVDTTQARGGGPRFCYNSGSVFYVFTPVEDIRIQADTLGSDYDTTLAVYRRTADGDVRGLECNDDRIGLTSAVRLRARAGRTYYFMVGVCCSYGRTGGGDLVFTVSEVDDSPLDYTLQFDPAGEVDAEGFATITATITCTTRSGIYAEGVLRQLRRQLFVARTWFEVNVGCTPGVPVRWSEELDTSTGVAFGPGRARIRVLYSSAYDGFGQWLSDDDPVVVDVRLLR